MNKNTIIQILPNPTHLFQTAAADFMHRAESAIKNKGWFTVVLSGGTTAKLFFDILAEYYKDRVDWQKVQFFFGDERYLPADDVENNYRIAYEHLFSKVSVPKENIYRMPTEFEDPNDAAIKYETTLRQFFHVRANEFPKFDLTYLGLGENAHTASLMPHTELVKEYSTNRDTQESHQLVAALFVPELNMYRLTLTPNAINNSAAIIFLVPGANKALAVEQVLEGPFLPEQYPAQLINIIHGKILWLLDRRSAEKLDVSNTRDPK